LENLKRKYHIILKFILASVFLISCNISNEVINPEMQSYYISNLECNNHNSFTYIQIDKKIEDTLFFTSINKNIFKQITSKWIIGQGTQEIYFDSGKENLFSIKTINAMKYYITIENSMNFSIDQPIVFWNSNKKVHHLFPALNKSWGFGKIIYEKEKKHFVTHIFECDTNKVSLYLAYSDDLKSWDIDSLPVLIAEQFKNINWNAPNYKGEMMVTPLVSDVVHDNGKYYVYVYGDNLKDNTFIGLLTCDSLNGEYTIHKTPLISPNTKSEFSNHDVYFPKIIRYNNKWLMFYTSKNKKNEEVICKAYSKDLIKWKVIKENIIKKNKGWNESKKNQLVAQVTIVNDTIVLWTTGIKNVKDQNEKLNKGNILDIAIGKFYSLDGGEHFIEAKGNPAIGGSPRLATENDHIGASFQEIILNDTIYTIYHGKGRNDANYKIKVRY
jgi:predicted GH43/DUF377 family glycosyl hydrolase